MEHPYVQLLLGTERAFLAAVPLEERRGWAANITRALGKMSDAGILEVKDLKNSISPTTGYELFKIISKAGANNLDHNKESKVEV